MIAPKTALLIGGAFASVFFLVFMSDPHGVITFNVAEGRAAFTWVHTSGKSNTPFNSCSRPRNTTSCFF